MFDRDSHDSAGDWDPPLAGGLVLGRGWCGASFGGGLIRFHDNASGPVAAANIESAFGLSTDRVGWVAFDWLGRQFGFMAPDASDARAVVVADVGMGQVVGMGTAVEFLDGVASGAIGDNLNHESFEAFRQFAKVPPLTFDQCVGFKVPPFLGGSTAQSNLEVSDVDVYWTLIGQIVAQVGQSQASAPPERPKRRWFSRGN